MWPNKFNNKTNGVTQRRWLAACNPSLSELITRKIGSGWITELTELKQLENFVSDEEFRQEWRAIKLNNKKRLAEEIEQKTGLAIPTGMPRIQAATPQCAACDSSL